MKSQWRISKAGDARQQVDDSSRQPAVCANDARSPVPLLVLLLVWMWPAVVQAQFEYKVEDGSITIIGYTGPGGAVTIPDTIHGLPVTAIGMSAFSMCTSLTSITIPDSVTSIAYSAFAYCTSLAGVVIPDGVIVIENWTFLDCSSLTDMVIPDGVTSIGDWAFARCTSLIRVMMPKSIARIGRDVFTGCTSLMGINVDADNAYFSSAEGVLFNKNRTVLSRVPEGRSGRYTVPDGVRFLSL
jgi:hypothetical protein